ncbi:MAG TPA: hypothetical protein VKE74_11705 [Gemmataceae bacterium]|nr:hypothetical protein [Gemmataceae bacterium]
MAKSSKPGLALTREQFRTTAKPLTVVINGKEFEVAKKEFSTGSLGWFLNDKMDIEVGGQKVKVQIGLNLTIIGSKDLPQDQPGTPPAAPAAAPADDKPTGQADF